MMGQNIQVYDYDVYGVKNISPTIEIEATPQGFDIYRYDNFGMKEIMPQQKVIKSFNGYQVYQKQDYYTTPIRTIEIDSI